MAIEVPFALEVQKMADGGFIVCDGSRAGDWRQMRFASSSIDEALNYIKFRLEAKPVK